MEKRTYFKELSSITNKIISILIADEELCKLVGSDSNTPLEDTVDGVSLINTRIFPMSKPPTAIGDKKTIINVYFIDMSPFNKNKGFKKEYVAFDIICDTDLWLIDGGIRPYEILNRIDNLFNDETISEISHSDVYFDSCIYKYWTESMSGFRMVYQLSNTNNTLQGMK